MKTSLIIATLAMFLFSLVLNGCQDPTIKEVEKACTSCPVHDPPPPCNDCD